MTKGALYLEVGMKIAPSVCAVSKKRDSTYRLCNIITSLVLWLCKYNSYSSLHQAMSHHPVTDYCQITAQDDMFYSLLSRVHLLGCPHPELILGLDGEVITVGLFLHKTIKKALCLLCGLQHPLLSHCQTVKQYQFNQSP